MFAVKFNHDGSIARLKAHLIAKGYAQTYRVDSSETFSLVEKLTFSICLSPLLLFMIGTCINLIS